LSELRREYSKPTSKLTRPLQTNEEEKGGEKGGFRRGK
jgi:hypothetical protein